jgi:hypothetical protein
MGDPKPSAKLVRLRRRKERLIERYLKLQDQVDRANGRIYGICCAVEQANLEIQREEARLRAAAARA